MKLAFAVMPWHALDVPCLASGILTAVACKSHPACEVAQVYANIGWADHLAQASSGDFTVDDYALLSNDFVYDLAGEWVFSAALRGPSPQSVAAYRELFPGTPEQFEKILFAYTRAPQFIADLAGEIAEAGVTALAISSTFTQNVACLALASAVKAIRPDIITMMGGGNCDGVQGEAIHRNFPCVDFVVRGEGETAFDALLTQLACERRTFLEVPNLCWRDGDRAIANPQVANENMDTVPMPDYAAYFEQLGRSGIQPHVQPALVIENARGCWWGQKHHCTFCGLNGSSMTFRSKSQARAVTEIAALAARHRTLDIVVTDNILDSNYFDEFLPTLQSCDWDLRMQYEIKANLKRPQIELMYAAGIRHVQPGIESLSSHVLRLMRKGVTGPRNVQALRDLEAANLTVSWNYLVGFPGETDADYTRIIAQLQHLHHLQPPRAGATRISLQRFSPFFNDPGLGFAHKTPHAAYHLLYALAPRELEQIAFFFETAPAGIDAARVEELQAAIDRWIAAYNDGSQLVFDDTEDGIVIVDARQPGAAKRTVLRGAVECAVFQALRSVISREGLCAQVLRSTGHGRDAVEASLDGFHAQGWIFEDDGLLIGLPTDRRPTRARAAPSALLREAACA